MRYFHAWIECPPPGWQESQDVAWINSESVTGPTPFNTGEDSHVSRIEPSNAASFISSDGEPTTDQFRMSKLNCSIDSLVVRRKSLTNDSSFDIVFEDPSRKSRNSCYQPRPEEEISETCSKKNISARSGDESYAVIRKPSGAAAKSLRREMQKARNYPVPEAKMFLFIQMQLCRKESLREWLRAHVAHRDTYQVLQMFNEIVRAVEYVHLQVISRNYNISGFIFNCLFSRV